MYSVLQLFDHRNLLNAAAQLVLTHKVCLLVVLVFAILLVFYLSRVQRLYLYFSGDELSRILERCSFVTDTYFPVPWLLTGRSHTCLAVLSSGPIESSYQREILKAPNGSTVAIDWFDHPEEVNKKFTGLLLIMNHACNGNLGHVNAAITNAGRFNLGCCMMTLPGISNLPLSASNVGFGLSFIVELQAILDRINQHVGVNFPKVSLALSMGGVPLLEFSALSPSFFSQVYISLPMNLDSFESEFCLKQAKTVYRQNAEYLTSIHPESPCMQATSLKELFKDPTSMNSVVSLMSLTRPTLLIYALDDESVPFVDTVDVVKLCRNKNVAIAATNVGGHCGFKTIFDNPGTSSWIVTASLEFLANSVKPEF